MAQAHAYLRPLPCLSYLKPSLLPCRLGPAPMVSIMRLHCPSATGDVEGELPLQQDEGDTQGGF